MVSIYGAMTVQRKSRIWELWRKGTPMSSIARDIAKAPATVFFISSVPPRHLASDQDMPCRMPVSSRARVDLSRGLAGGTSYRAIACELGRSASTISREVGRNGGPGKYRAYDAEKQFLKRARRPKPYLLAS